MIFFFFQAEDGIRDFHVTGVQTCALPILCASTCDSTKNKHCVLLMSGGVRSLWTSVGRIPFHPLVGSPHVPAMDAGPERYELRQQRRVRARGVLRVLLTERSGGYRFLQALAGSDRFSH